MFVLCCFVLGCGSVGFVSINTDPQTHGKAAVTTQQDWRTQRTKHHTVCNNDIIQETNPIEPQLKTKQNHKTNIEVKKRFIRVTQIICSNYKMYIMTYL